MDESIPKIQVSFTGRDLKNLIIPMFMEQFLLALTGIVDTFVVSYAGEADVSGVSLVNSFNTVFIFLSTALSIGGAGRAFRRSAPDIFLYPFGNSVCPDSAPEQASPAVSVRAGRT